MPTYYQYKIKPYKHQVKALRALIRNGFGGALLMEPRTGKTKVCVDYASILHQAGKVDRVLIICPSAIMDVWVEEIRAHCPWRRRITVWDRKGRKVYKLPTSGTGILDFVIMNYDALAVAGAPQRDRKTGAVRRDDEGNIKRSRRGGRFEVYNQIKNWAPHLIVLDESHRIKSPSAKRSKMIVRLGAVADYRVLATGTVVTKANRIHDLYMQWCFLNPDSPVLLDASGSRMNSQEFKQEYGRWIEKNGYPQWVGPREDNLTRLRAAVHDESYAVTRDECFDLPPAYPDVIIPIDLVKSAKAYDDMAETMVAQIESGEITEASIRLVQNLRFSQITSGLAKTEPTPDHPEGRWVRIGSEKLEVLRDLLSDWAEQDERVVICARFREDIHAIQEVCRKLKVRSFVLIGGQDRSERTKAIRQFREHKGAAVFIMNPQAGSEGIDLRTASTMVWYSLTQSYVNYTQARDRIALSGKANRYVFLLARGTYDEIQYEVLQNDGDVAKLIMKDPRRLLRTL